MNRTLSIFTILLFSLINIGCINEGKGLKNPPEVVGPFSFEEKSKTSLILSKYFCLSENSNLENIREIVKKELIKEKIDLNIINSYEVILAANKIANLLESNCVVDSIDDEEIKNIFNKQFKFN